MPDKLCKECTEKVYLFYDFKVSIEQNDSTLRSVLFKESSIKKNTAVFDESNTYLGLGIKTEIAFVDADPFIDDDGDFDYINASTTENSESTTLNHHHDQQHQQQIENSNAYQHDVENEEEIIREEGNNENDGELINGSEVNDEEEIGEIEEDENEGEDIEENIEESFEIGIMSKENKIKKKVPTTTENVDYVKDEDGKFICQICNKKLTDKKGLNLHFRYHTGKDLKRCNICFKGEVAK